MFLAVLVIQGAISLERLAEYRALVDCAKKAAESAYAPYSKTAQGAALLSADGKIFKGAKMECASYGAAVCAETAALTAAISEGVRRFQAIAIHPSEYPCGTSRQMLAEFGINLDVVIEDSSGHIEVVNLRELLPSHFGPHNLS
ncbi:MAG: cytidine deaminase [Candidatus Melainabacteria bacterium]|nr:cytidine deaminase [Candidatus Melainabacteria bacterium]